jgi:hypothetical protein
LALTPPGQGIYADFSWPEIATSSLTLQVSPYCFHHYGVGCWVLAQPNGVGFYAIVDSPTAGERLLSVRHLTSASDQCPGGGYSPVTVYLNGNAVVENLDPASAHGGSHGFETDTWRLFLEAGENVIEWDAGDLCTTYWIQRLEITPVELPTRFDPIRLLRSGAAELTFRGTPGRAWTIEASEDLATWTTLTNAPPSTGTLVIRDDEAKYLRQRFYRATVKP